MKKFRPFQQARWVNKIYAKELCGQTDYSGSDREDELKEGKAGRKKAG